MFSACGCKSGTVKFHIPVRFLCSKSPLSQDIFVQVTFAQATFAQATFVPGTLSLDLVPLVESPTMRWIPRNAVGALVALADLKEIPRATPGWLVKRLAADAPARQLLPLGAFVRSQPLTVGQTATGGAGHGGCGSAAPLLRAPDFDSNGSWPC